MKKKADTAISAAEYRAMLADPRMTAIEHAGCVLYFDAQAWRMERLRPNFEPSRHSLQGYATNLRRLRAHWRGFVQAHLAERAEART